MKAENSQMLLRKYAKRLTAEAILKSLMVSFTIAFGVAFVVAAISWFKGANTIIVCLGILVGLVMLGTPIFYLTMFRPTLKGNAKRIDLLGLDERTVTMVELEDDDSIISRLQREDARSHLEKINEKMLKIRIARKMWLSLSVSAVLGSAMIVVSLLAAFGFILSGADLMAPFMPEEEVKYVYVEYWIEEGGYIVGEEFQEVILGEDAGEVMAVAEEGWIFMGWDDGYTRPERTEFGVTEDILRVAIFEPLPAEGDGEDGSGNDSQDGEPGDQTGDEQGDSQDNGQNSPSGAGGKYEPANQAVDGETYYRDILQQYADVINEYLSTSQDIPEDVRKIIELYMEIIG